MVKTTVRAGRTYKMGAAESSSSQATDKNDGHFKAEEIILCCSDTGQHGKNPTKTKPGLPQNIIIHAQHRDADLQPFSPRTGSTPFSRSALPESRKFKMPEITMRRATQPGNDYVHFLDSESPCPEPDRHSGQSVVDVYNRNRNVNRLEVSNHPYTFNAEQIPPGFCSFKGTSSRERQARFDSDPRIPNTGCQERRQVQPAETREVKSSSILASDEEIWQEYTRESRRLKAEHQMLKVRNMLFFD